jgi:cellulose synthase/poly-beta-1,6-N-acetylglucosamine synthase-like glycosyltransferase
VSDGSTDGTEELLARHRQSVLKTILLKDHCGKAAALNAGVREATSEVIVFQDLRPEPASGAIQQLVGNFADPEVGCAAGELVLRREGSGAGSEAVSGLYWRYEKWIRKCEASFDSPVGVSGCFYAIRRELFTPQPDGLILDDMFQPLSIIRKGYRSVLDPQACVYDVLPEKVEGEFHRKVRTLAGNFQLFQLAPWTLSPSNRVFFQLVSHKVIRLIVPYLLVLLLVSSAALAGQSPAYGVFAALESLGIIGSLIGLRYKIPILHRVLAPCSALLVLNAAAVVGLYKFLFTSGPLWKIWNMNGSGLVPSIAEESFAKPEGVNAHAAIEVSEGSSCINPH